MIRVQDAGEVLGGRQRSPSAQGEMTPYLRVANVFTGHIDTSDVLQMPFTADERSRFALRSGDILLNEGQSLDLVGRSAIYQNEPPSCCFQNTLVRFRAGASTDPNYAQYIFESYLRRGEFAKIALQTTSIAHLGAGRFAQMAFLAPPLKEQAAIGKSLADTDALIDSLERLLTKKRQIKQGAMQELLTGKRRLPGFDGEWEMKRLGEMAELMKGSGLSKDAMTASGGRKCILYGELFTTYGQVIHDVVGRTNSSDGLVSISGDVLVPGSTTTDGIDLATASALLESGVALGGDINVVRPKDADSFDPCFLANYLTHVKKREIAERAQGTTIVHLYGRDLSDLWLHLPSLVEQGGIAQVLSEMEVEITALESRLTKAQCLKQAMAQALLSGRIRLVDPTA